jgi:hypothetical protein
MIPYINDPSDESGLKFKPHQTQFKMQTLTSNNVVVATPRYVLLIDNEKMGPTVLSGDPDSRCVAIYGFSDKGPYDKFRENGDLSLKPYPLVKGYLRNQLSNDNGNESECLRLVVLDSSSPDERIVHAASMQAVLDSMMNQKPDVPVEYKLSLVKANGVYRLDDTQQSQIQSNITKQDETK